MKLRKIPFLLCAILLLSAIAGGCKGKGGDITLEGAALKGKEIYTSKGCSACHSLDGSSQVGPSFAGLYGKEVEIVTGGESRRVMADEAYLKKSIVSPREDIVKGFENVSMPVPSLTDEEVDALIAFIRAMKGGS